MEIPLNNAIYDKAITIQSEIINRPITPFQHELNQAIHKAANQAAKETKSDNNNSPIRLIPATTGAGKSSAVLALIAASYALDENYSSAFVCNTIEEAHRAYLVLRKYIPENDVYIHSSAHSSEDYAGTRSKYGETIADHAKHNPSKKSDLSNVRIIICTHQHWINEGNFGVDFGVRFFKSNTPRTHVFVDEMPNLCTIEEVYPSDILYFQELLDCRYEWNEAREVINSVHSRMSKLVRNTGVKNQAVSIITKEEFVNISEITPVLFQDEDPDSRIGRVINFLKNAAEGRVFITRGHRTGESVTGHNQRIAFSSFNSNIHPHSGLTILDATAEYSALNNHPDAVLTAVPAVDYRNLKLTHIEAPKEFHNVAQRAPKSKADKDYLAWIKKTVSSNTDVGEIVLVVAHKRFCDQLPCTKMSVDGRTVYVVHWGKGIGSNKWKDCSSVFLFAELHLPRTVYVSSTVAVQDRAILDADFSHDRGTKAGENHRLHLFKQLGCRGLVRNIDELGRASEMKLFTSMDRSLLLRGYKAVFPGAKPPVFIQPEFCKHKTKGEKLAHFLLGYTGPNINLCAVKVANHLGFKVSELATAFGSAKCRDVAALGWSFVNGKRAVSKPMLTLTDPIGPDSFIGEYLGIQPKLKIERGHYMVDFKATT